MASGDHENLIIPPGDLECPICYEIYPGKLFLCSTGHALCSKCTTRLSECALCQAPFTQIRCLPLEHLISQYVRRSCRYKNGGCEEKILIKDIEDHAEKCQFGYMCYHYEGGDVSKEKCSWMGHISKLESHVETCHPAIISRSKPVKISHEVAWTGPKQLFSTLLKVFDELFWCLWSVRTDEGKMFAYVRYAGPSENAARFRYSYEFFSEAGKNVLVGGEMWNAKESVFITQMVPLTQELVGRLIGKDNLLRCYVEITRNPSH